MMAPRWWRELRPELRWTKFILTVAAVSPCLAVIAFAVGDPLTGVVATIAFVGYSGLAVLLLRVNRWRTRHGPVVWVYRDPTARHRAGKSARWWR